MSKPLIEYRRDAALDLDSFIELYQASTLAERRPADDRDVMRQMMENASVTISAWDDGALVGIARTLTDFGYVAYLADLAVAKSHQRHGIGKGLIEETQAALGPRCMLVLLSAPAANAFYPRIGFTHNPRAWVLAAGERVR
jgi:GNAT superfamily N-acetyltransferase